MPDLPWFVYAMLLAPLGLILVAAAYKTLQVRAAREWPSTPGKVVVSNSEVREVKVIDSDRAERAQASRSATSPISSTNIPSRGQKLRNNRVSIGEDRGNFQVAETIAKYPVGAIVTVYYNPLHPRRGGAGARPAEGPVGLPRHRHGDRGGDRVRLGDRPASASRNSSSTHLAQSANVGRRLSRRRAFGLVEALFALVLHRQSSLAMKWPVVSGTIKLSDLEQYRAAPTEGSSRGQIMYQRRVSYTYKYNNLAYTNVHATLASSVASTSSWLVRKSTTDYKNGATVKVWVNPDNPSQATLEPRAGFVWVLWLVSRGDLGRGVLRGGARLDQRRMQPMSSVARLNRPITRNARARAAQLWRDGDARLVL